MNTTTTTQGDSMYQWDYTKGLAGPERYERWNLIGPDGRTVATIVYLVLEGLASTVPPIGLGEPIGDGEVPERVAVHSRGAWRFCRVVKITPARVAVAYTTAGGLEEAARRGWSKVNVTEITVSRLDARHVKGEA